MTEQNKMFVSHAHADKAIAEELARALRSRGVEAWLDKWEIAPGDSLVQKIFEEGLKGCSVFLVLLSPDSVKSRWVARELDVALVRQIESTTRVVPVVVRSCEIPEALRPLLRVDLSAGVDMIATQLADLAHGRWDGGKPPLGLPPGPALKFEVEGLSSYASAIAVHIAPGLLDESGSPSDYSGEELAAALKLTLEQLNDAVEELREDGLVKVEVYVGCAPFSFSTIKPTYQLGLKLRGSAALSYDPEHDILTVSAAITAAGTIEAKELASKANLPPARVNRAIEFLQHRGLAEVSHSLGSAPFSFVAVNATRQTRQFVRQNAR